jgi:hypothetical protein
VRLFQKGFKSDHRMQALFAHSKPGKARSTERLTEDLSLTDVGVAEVQGLLEAHFPNVRASSPGIQAFVDGSSPAATSVGWPLAV